jgi:hypothetical protein
VEDQIEPRWRKSSYSGNGGSDCVEAATRSPATVAVRDSKNPDGPILTVVPAGWRDFIADIKLGRHDLT